MTKRKTTGGTPGEMQDLVGRFEIVKTLPCGIEPSGIGDKLIFACFSAVIAPALLAMALAGCGMAVMAARFLCDSVATFGRPSEIRIDR